MIFWDEQRQSWMWDRWNCNNATPIMTWIAVRLHFNDKESVKEEDVSRLEQAKHELETAWCK